MLYLAIDQHKNHLTINIRNEHGDVLQKGQVSTKPDDKHRVGGITKRGNAIARQVLNFAVIHITRKDPAMKEWHKKIKKRRGAKTARVTVMRKLATIIWHMLRWGKPYQFRYDPPPTTPKKGDLRSPKEVLEGIGNRNHSRKKEGTPLKCRGKTKA